MPTKFRAWLPTAIAITLSIGTAYGLVQQSLRMNANDPQVEITEELSSAVTNVEDPSQFDSAQKLDITKSLSAFWIVYDENGKPLASSGQFNGKIPEVPQGALDRAKTSGENRITWQPQKNARMALVIRPYTGKSKGFVVAGRSMREVEKREQNLLLISLLGWIITMAASLLAALFLPNRGTRHPAVATSEEHHHAA